MDFSIIKKLSVYREERFRTPCELERELGIWVDRIGFQTSSRVMPGLRRLGQYAAVFIEKGRGELIHASHGVFKLQAGDIIILFPEEPVAYSPDQNWSEKWIVWNGPEATLLENAGFLKKSCFLLKGKRKIFTDAFDSLHALIHLQSKSAILDRKIILTRLILNLHAANLDSSRQNWHSGNIEAAADFLEANYSSDVSVDELASRYNLSPGHFRLLFKEYAGTSPRKFVTNLRISAAKKMLMQGLSIKEAARFAGFQDVLYFIRVFKTTTGSSPGSWRKTQDENSSCD
jgi:AraC-like DNA-binding protein